MYPKIDIYVNRIYVCSTEQAKNCKEARDRFLLNPSFAAIQDGKMTIITMNRDDIYTVRCEYAE